MFGNLDQTNNDNREDIRAKEKTTLKLLRNKIEENMRQKNAEITNE